jgi:hypothetical protein
LWEIDGGKGRSVVIQLNLPKQLEERLKQEAGRRGLAPDACALQTLDQHLPGSADRQAAALALLQQWSAEDAEMSPEEAAENAAVLRALDEDRLSYRPLFADIFLDSGR